MEFITSPPAPSSPSILIIQQICSANTRTGVFLANFITSRNWWGVFGQNWANMRQSGCRWIQTYICPNCKMYLSKFQNVFVQIPKCISPRTLIGWLLEKMDARLWFVQGFPGLSSWWPPWKIQGKINNIMKCLGFEMNDKKEPIKEISPNSVLISLCYKRSLI